MTALHLTAALLAALFLLACDSPPDDPPPSPALPTERVRVTDGDTVVRVNGERVRAAGYNAPETSRPKCPRERELGQRAKARLEELVAEGVHLAPNPKGPAVDRYGRLLRSLVLPDGRLVAEILIAEDLAEEYWGRGPYGTRWCQP